MIGSDTFQGRKNSVTFKNFDKYLVSLHSYASECNPNIVEAID